MPQWSLGTHSHAGAWERGGDVLVPTVLRGNPYRGREQNRRSCRDGAWVCIPTQERGNEVEMSWFPRSPISGQRVEQALMPQWSQGMHSHAGAWERGYPRNCGHEKTTMLALSRVLYPVYPNHPKQVNEVFIVCSDTGSRPFPYPAITSSRHRSASRRQITSMRRWA
jgi:hypothetical protein